MSLRSILANGSRFPLLSSCRFATLRITAAMRCFATFRLSESKLSSSRNVACSRTLSEIAIFLGNQKMSKNKKQLFTIPVFAVIASALSVIHQTRISPEGFLSSYRGPTYIGRGWPWMYYRIYESGEANLDFNLLLLTFVFWVIAGILSFSFLKVIVFLISKAKNRNIR